MMPNTDYRINILQQTKKIVVEPPQQIIAKADTQADDHALLDVTPTKMGPELDYPTIAQWTQRK